MDIKKLSNYDLFYIKISNIPESAIKKFRLPQKNLSFEDAVLEKEKLLCKIELSQEIFITLKNNKDCCCLGTGIYDPDLAYRIAIEEELSTYYQSLLKLHFIIYPTIQKYENMKKARQELNK